MCNNLNFVIQVCRKMGIPLNTGPFDLSFMKTRYFNILAVRLMIKTHRDAELQYPADEMERSIRRDGDMPPVTNELSPLIIYKIIIIF